MTKYYIYKHTFPNNKVYIGITCQLPEIRWGKDGEGYLSLDKTGQPTQAKMYHAIKKYGWQNIQHEIIEIVYSKREAEEKERYYITKIYKSHFTKYGYNIMRGGDYNGKFTAKTKQKISNSIKQAYQTSEAMWMKRIYMRLNRWWTDGKKNRGSRERPGENWLLGKKLRSTIEAHPLFTKRHLAKFYKK